MQPARCDRQDDVAVFDALCPEHGVGLDHAGGGARQIVFLGGHEARVFSRLTAQKRNGNLFAGLGDAAHDIGDPLGNHLSTRNVIRHEERARPNHGDVVNNHADEVLTDRLVDVKLSRNGNLRAHTVGGSRQQWPPVLP